MPRKSRAQRFLWDPQAYLTDPAVMRMTLEERGAYSTLLFALWLQKEPGVAPNDPRILAHLAGCTPEEWSRVTSAVTGALVTRDSGVTVTSPLMIATANGQDMSREKWRKRKQAQRMRGRDRGVDVTPMSPVGSGSGSGSGSEKDNPPVGPPTKPAATKAPKRTKAPPNRTITQEDVNACAKRYGLAPEVVAHLADRIEHEGPQRGYVSYPSALREWCRREAANPQPESRIQKPPPKDGETDGNLVWFRGGWRTHEMAAHLGFKPNGHG